MSTWLNAAVMGVLSAVLTGNTALASMDVASRQGISPTFQGLSSCPERCAVLGPEMAKWPAYRKLGDLDDCKESMLLGFSVHDDVDNDAENHRIFACTTYGNDWTNTKNSKIASLPADQVDVVYGMGWNDSAPVGEESGHRAVAEQMREYLKHGHGASNTSEILFAQFGDATAGLYLGQGLRSTDVANDALNALTAETQLFKGSRDTLAIQLCGDDYDSDHTFGFMGIDYGSFEDIQSAIKTWSTGKCVDFKHSKNYTSKAPFTSPLLSDIKAKNGSSVSNSTTQSSKDLASRFAKKMTLFPRAECRTVQVVAQDTCAKLAKRCGISGPDFTKYNSADNFCATLMPGGHACCSPGDMPDFRPKPNDDGSCATVSVSKGQTCSSIAAARSLTVKDIEGFNKKTWGFNGCKNLWAEAVICVSKGSPPMPNSIANAVCGPQKPGTKKPDNMEDLAKLNPCPLNACCDVFGQCGTTEEFCVDTNTGAPGTAEKGTNGCISNCGTDIIKSPVSEFRSVAYYEGFSFGRKCLFQDASQIDGSQYTHLHFGFGDISPNFDISIGDEMSTYEFNNFRYIRGPKKILSFGGWAFSNDPDTYNIMRQGVKPANRVKLAQNIADFINKNGLDGVDIDWEYPGATDIPGTPPGNEGEGDEYAAFLTVLKKLMPNKSVSIAAPASYWYLKGFPIERIGKVVDYIIFMTYDLHGQWDAGNKHAQIGCPDGMCLRSQVNLTETMTALSMVTKAGVPSGKVVVGVTSYGRSFGMAQAGCDGPNCKYTGGRLSSTAKKGECTDTAGYISNAEISKIIKDGGRVNKKYIDKGSHSNILVYDNTEWVAYMDADIRNARTRIYKAQGMGGTTNWATDLESFNDPPKGVKDWANFRLQIKSGNNPLHSGDRNGNWTELSCDSDVYTEIYDYTPKERWLGMDANDAWKDIVDDWKDHRKEYPDDSFTRYVAYLTGGPTRAECGEIRSGSGCRDYKDCKEFDNDKSGPAAALIWNSFVSISSLYAQYHESLVAVSALLIDNSLDDFEQTFAPVPPPKDDTWITALLNIVAMGVPAVGGKFFTNFISKLPALAKQTPETLAKGKELTTTLMSGAVTLTTTLRPDSSKIDDWTDEATKQFTHYIGQSLYVWDNTTANSLMDLFDGSDDSLDKLSTLLADGNFIDGSGERTDLPKSDKPTVEKSFVKSFYGFAIPEIWQKSGHRPFIIDTGKGCDDDAGNSNLKSACVDGRRYQLADPDGDAYTCRGCDHGTNRIPSAFSNLAGSDELKDGNWGGVTVEDIITGAVKTFKQNGETLGGGIADATDSGTFDALVKDDITTPGYIRLPVCSETRARKSWDNADLTDSVRDQAGYPCNANNGKDYCGDSTFEDQTSDASPPKDDCKVIIKNIEDTDGSWNTFIEQQRELVHFGECKFGVTGKGRKGNSNFDVGAQDIIDILNTAMDKFGGDTGKIGAKGTMQCNGNIKKQKVEWGIY